jgi:ATP-dependent protease Clp ATPase subunit
VAKVAIGRKSGARGLRAILEKALMETMFTLPEHPEVVRVVVDKDVIEKGAQPQMVVDETKRRLPQGQQVHARREAPKTISEQSSVS